MGGNGFDMRLYSSILFGCVPLITQERTHQPLQNILRYEKFSLSFSRSEVKRLPELLHEKPDEMHASLLKNVRSVVNALHWKSEFFPNGTAFEHTLLEIATVLRLRPPKGILKRIREVHGDAYVHEMLRLEPFIS